MPSATLRGASAPIEIWAELQEVDSGALDQLRRIADLPWVHHHVAAMPDVHVGFGATVGSVIAMRDAVSPSAVGVDIGCGMAAVRTNLTASDLPDDLGALRSAVEAAIPVGFSLHDNVSREVDRLSLWQAFEHLTSAAHGRLSRAQRQLGTLGGGNHFLELCLDDGRGEGPAGAGAGAGEPRVWIIPGSGRGNPVLEGREEAPALSGRCCPRMYSLMIDSGVPPQEAAKEDGAHTWSGSPLNSRGSASKSAQISRMTCSQRVRIASSDTPRLYVVTNTKCACRFCTTLRLRLVSGSRSQRGDVGRG